MKFGMPYQSTAGWDADDWRVAYEERAAILEYDEGLPRLKAEALARHWLKTMGYNPAALGRPTFSRRG